MDRDLTKATRARRTLVFGSVTHVWNDLLFALFIPLLPLIRDDPELGLSYTQVGLLRTAHAGASTALQVPFGFLAERTGEFWLLIGGNVWVAVGLLGITLVHSYVLIVGITVLGGLGGGTQHPLASGMVSRAFDSSGRSTAVGAVNFAGDLGKMAAPIVALLWAGRYGWRGTIRLVGVVVIVFMALSAAMKRAIDFGEPALDDQAESGRDGREDAAPDTQVQMSGFVALSAVGFLDSGIRGAAVTFIPFVLQEKGLGTTEIFGMLVLLLGGGAAGKFVFGWLDDRYGSVSLIWGSKGLTALLFLAVLAAPVALLAPLMIVLGIGLNGTSSVLYSTVPAFVPAGRRARLYGFYYTTSEGGATVAPWVFGRIADLSGLRGAMIAMSIVTALILPASLPLGRHLASNGDRDASPPLQKGD